MKLNTKEKCTIIDLIDLNIKDTTGGLGVRSYRKFLRNLKEKFKLTPDEEKEEKKLYCEWNNSQSKLNTPLRHSS